MRLPRPSGARGARQSAAALPRAFYARPTLDVARDLIGKELVHAAADGTTSGVIVEVEAYIGEGDPACHAAAGLTARTAPLYGPPGYAYVYLNYGMHYLMNVVTEADGVPAAVLLRAVEPRTGAALMRARRASGSGRRIADNVLGSGPGNLGRAFGLTLEHNRLDLCDSRLFLIDGGTPAREVAWSTRIGLRVGTDLPWRCFAVDSPSVSGPLRLRRQSSASGSRSDGR